jgi:TolB-like protein
VERRLAAILAADVVGYSRLMSEDEAGTLERLKSLRRELVQPKIAECKGRIVKLMGDGLLAEFPSAVEAVQCAVDIQQEVAEREPDISDDRRVRLRIGINIGDIIVEGEDIYGDGVNIAARLEGLAEPGGICVARNVFNQVKTKVESGFEDLGEQEVKNIPEPVHVYRVSIADADQVGRTTTPEALPLPDKPSIAVMPFTNLSGDTEQQYFSDGITFDIITALGKFRNLFVIADTSSFAYRDTDVAVQQIGQDLGVHYILKGNLRAAGGKIRVSVQLIDAVTGQNVWAERYDHVLDDVFALQDEITQTIVGTMVGRIEDADHVRTKHTSTTTPSAYEYILRGRQCLGDYSEDEILKARTMFEQALELDPNYARAYIELAETHYVELLSPWSKAPDIAVERLSEYAQKAVALDDLDSRTHLALARAYRVKANHELAEAQFETAIELNPNDVWNYCGKGFLLTCLGRLDEGISCDTYALRLNPLLPDTCLYSIGIAHYLGRRYEDAIATFCKMSYLPTEILGCLAASYAQLGRDGEARKTATECHDRAVAEFAPGLDGDVERWRAYWLRFIPLKEVTDRDHLFDGLRKAGLPA